VGLSVSRAELTSPDQLVGRIGDPATGSRVAGAGVRELRALGLDVVSDPLPEDPGHAVIVPGAGELKSRSMRRRVAKLFRLIDPPT
jgi:hypothetical protein